MMAEIIAFSFTPPGMLITVTLALVLAIILMLRVSTS